MTKAKSEDQVWNYNISGIGQRTLPFAMARISVPSLNTKDTTESPSGFDVMNVFLIQ